MLFSTNDDELYQRYLAKVYQDSQGFQQYSDVRLARERKANICLTYGELLYPSVKKMLRALKLGDSDTFLDLGSGLGKCALQTFMQTAANRVIGIEAAKALHEQTQRVQIQVHHELPGLWEGGRSIEFVYDNFVTGSWYDATVVYTCSTCFTPELLSSIGERVNDETSVKKVLSLRPLPTLARLRLKKVFAVECSWDSALAFLYG